MVPWQFTEQYVRLARAVNTPICTGEDIYLNLAIMGNDDLRSQEADFHELAAAAILVLLAVLMLMNAGAVILRNKFQKRF